MKIKLLTLLVAGVCLASHTFGQPVSQLGYTNTFRSNDLLSISAKTASGYASRAASYGNLSNSIAGGVVGAQPWAARDTVTSNGAVAFAVSLAYGTNWPVYNVVKFGASGVGDYTADSPAIKVAISNAAYFGGIVYFPRGTYMDTNTYILPAAKTVGTSAAQTGPFLEFQGDGIDTTHLYVACTNAVYLNCSGQTPNIKRMTFVNANPSASLTNAGNILLMATNGYGVMSVIEDVYANFFYVAADIYAVTSMRIENFEAYGSYMGLRIGGYADRALVSANFRHCFAGLVIGGHEWIENVTRTAGIAVSIGGADNVYNAVWSYAYAGSLSGNSERNTNASIAIGYPPEFSLAYGGLEHYCRTGAVPQLTINGYSDSVPLTPSNDLIRVYTTANNLVLANSRGATLLHFMTNTAEAYSGFLSEGNYGSSALVKWSDGSTYAGDTTARARRTWSYNWSWYNYEDTAGSISWALDVGYGLTLPTGKIRIGHTYDSDSTPAHADVNMVNSSSWKQLFGTAYTGGAQNWKAGMQDYSGTTTPLYMIGGAAVSAGTTRVNIGGGSSAGKPVQQIDFYCGDSTVAHSGSNSVSISQTSLNLNNNTSLYIVGKPAAGFPSAGVEGRILRCSDLGSGGSLWIDTGSIWIPLAGHTNAYVGSFSGSVILQTNTPAVTPTHGLLFTNQFGQVFKVAAEKL